MNSSCDDSGYSGPESPKINHLSFNRQSNNSMLDKMRSRKYKLKSLFANQEISKKKVRSKKRCTSKRAKGMKINSGDAALWKSNDRSISLTPPPSKFKRTPAVMQVL